VVDPAEGLFLGEDQLEAYETASVEMGSPLTAGQHSVAERPGDEVETETCPGEDVLE
jgi:hypothetical protein